MANESKISDFPTYTGFPLDSLVKVESPEGASRSLPVKNLIYPQKNTISPEPNTAFASNLDGSVINEILSVGLVDEKKMICVNAVAYIQDLYFVENDWMQIARIPDPFRPRNVIHAPAVEYFNSDQFKTVGGVTFSGVMEWPSKSTVRIRPDGYIDVFCNGAIVSHAIATNNYIIAPLNFTYFKIPEILP